MFESLGFRGSVNVQAPGVRYRLLTPHTGAEVSGVDLSQDLPQEEVDDIQRLLVNYGAVFFRDQRLTREQHRVIGRRFGALHIHPAAPAPEGYPEILIIHADDKHKGVAGSGWHSDVSCDPEPPAASMLYMKHMPAVGGDTLFSNMYAAYEALSDDLKTYLEGLTAVHSGADVYRGGGYKSSDQGARLPVSEHPVIRTHPVTLRKALFVNYGFTRQIVGVPRRESEAMLRFLFEHVNDPLFICRFRWAPNSIAFWDNRCVQHYPTDDYFPATRTAERVTICGDRPFYEEA
ncbi:MAG TPA: TauD/TfdA family dioxygenase [Pseudomonadales bacterium]